MILKFKFKSMWWGYAAMPGPNMFIKCPTSGEYKNFSVGPLKNVKAGAIITEVGLNELRRRKHVEILEEYNNEDKEQLRNDGDSKIPSS